MTRWGRADVFVLCIGLLVCGPGLASAQIKVPAVGYKNSLGIGASAGVNLSRDATFFGFAPDYTRMIGARWLVNTGPSWDRDREKKDGKTEVADSWTWTVAVGYGFTQRLFGAVGYGREFAKTNDEGRMGLTSSGDDSVGAIGAYVLWMGGRQDLTATVSVERNLTQKETTLSFDVGYAFGF